MKILLAHNYYQTPGGEDAVVRMERKLLQAEGHEVLMYEQRNSQIDTFARRIETFVTVAGSNKSKRNIIDKLHDFAPDIIHVHNFFPLITPSIYDAALECNIPVIQTLHNYRLLCASAMFLRDQKPCEICLHKSQFNAVRYACYRGSVIGSFAVANMIRHHRDADTWNIKVDRFIALSEFAKQKFIAGGINAEKISVKGNFIEARLDVEPRDRSKTVLFVGRLSEEKGVQILLDAWAKVSDPALRLKIIGDGPQFELVQSRAREMDNIEVLGQQSAKFVAEAMATATCLAFPSISYEGFPLVLAEALAAGLPIVSSNLGAMKSILEQGRTGLLFEPGNPDHLFQAMATILNDDALSRAMSENCQREYQLKYTPQQNYQQLMAIYQEVLGARLNKG